MKPNLRLLPTEVWVDIFCFPWTESPPEMYKLPNKRSEVGQLVDRIGNRKFAEFLQFYLHEWGKHTLKYLVFEKTGLRHPQTHSTLEIPQTEMPENIRFFEGIQISHFDAQTLGFLHQIQRIFNGVNLAINGFSTNEESFRIILAHLLPLLNGIDALCFSDIAVPRAPELFKSNKFDQLKVLSINRPFGSRAVPLDATINFSLNWLTSERRDCTEPRLFRPYISNEQFEPICAAIKKNFLSAKSPCTFAVLNRFGPTHFDDFHLENNIGEHLHGKKITEMQNPGPFVRVRTFYQITRHQANAGKALQGWVEEIEDKCNGNRVTVCCDATIGQIDATGGGEVNGGGEGKASDQPSTSKG